MSISMLRTRYHLLAYRSKFKALLNSLDSWHRSIGIYDTHLQNDGSRTLNRINLLI